MIFIAVHRIVAQLEDHHILVFLRRNVVMVISTVGTDVMNKDVPVLPAGLINFVALMVKDVLKIVPNATIKTIVPTIATNKTAVSIYFQLCLICKIYGFLFVFNVAAIRIRLFHFGSHINNSV